MKILLPLMAMVIPLLHSCEIMPRNTLNDCRTQCNGSDKSRACMDFCDCIHVDGKPLDSCLSKYDKAPVDSVVMTR
jgi:hypothetical protein